MRLLMSFISMAMERMRRIIESEVGRGIEINKPGNFLRKAAANGTQFLSRNRMPNQHRAVDLKRLHHRKDVIAEVVRRIIAIGRCRIGWMRQWLFS